jgi:hypothetical protein
MKGEAKFVHNAYFPESLKFFEICAESLGSFESQLKFWWQKEREYLHRPASAAAMIHQPALSEKTKPHDTTSSTDHPQRPKRRRKRRRPKKNPNHTNTHIASPPQK